MSATTRTDAAPAETKPSASLNRRNFIASGGALAAGIGLANSPLRAFAASGDALKPALLGGAPLREKGWSRWPLWDSAADEKRVLDILRSGVWSRAAVVTEFEKKWAETVGAKRCLAVVNGTNALIAALVQLDIGGGDEVLVPPYTFIATIIAVLQTGAIPVFVDTDPETFQIDATKIEAKITPKTRAILPVHILGLPADMEAIMRIAKAHNLLVVEDACQAWLAEINHKKMGTFGNAGCFSFQNSKNLTMGEGGAIVSDDDAFMDRCCSYHNYGNPYGATVGAVGAAAAIVGTKLRITEYQAAIGLAQLARLEEQTATRNANAAYLKAKIKDLPGIVPYRLYDTVTRAAFHLFPFRYKPEAFHGMPRATFIKALCAEGIPCSSGYVPQNKMPFLANAFRAKNFRRMYRPEELDYAAYLERNQCPENDRLCEEAVWLTQNLLLGEKSDMDDIARAIEKLHRCAEILARA